MTRISTNLITTLAMYQTLFWAGVGEVLREKGEAVAFISFDDRSTELLKEKGFQVFSLEHQDVAVGQTYLKNVDGTLNQFGIENVNFWLAHERVTFDIFDRTVLEAKLFNYLALCDRAVNCLSSQGSVTMIQELGGFVSVIAAFFAAKKNGVDNWFIEPSFFRGRQFFLKNSFKAIEIPYVADVAVGDEVKTYLAETRKSRAIVVPIKDKHQYTTAFKKVINLKNLKRLLGKAFDKYILGKHQEFGHIGNHVSKHLKMILNSRSLRKNYTPLGSVGSFIYYPLHVPGDMALTLRSPEYLDQLALIDYLARMIPRGFNLAIKEHPAMVGAVDSGRLKTLLAMHDNLKLIPPATNNYDVLGQAQAVVSVNSKSGAEAILLGKPVYVLGDAFYATSPAVHCVKSLTELPSQLINAGRTAEKDAPSVEPYFELVWRKTYPGELYVCTDDNLRIFAASLLSAIGH